jgi:hypothetical protein
VLLAKQRQTTQGADRGVVSLLGVLLELLQLNHT